MNNLFLTVWTPSTLCLKSEMLTVDLTLDGPLGIYVMLLQSITAIQTFLLWDGMFTARFITWEFEWQKIFLK